MFNGDGVKRTQNIRTAEGAVSFPAVQMGDSWMENVTLANGKTRPQEFAALISLRTPNPKGEYAGGAPYLHYSPRENLYFAPRRFDHVVGLDVDADGAILTEADLEMKRNDNIVARQNALAAAAEGVSVAVDLD